MTRIKGMDVGFTEEEQEEMLDLLAATIRSGYLMWGEMQERLQAAFQELTGRRYAVTFNSNTSAQEVVFHVLRPRRVAFLGNQFPSPVFAAVRQGAEPVFVDIDPVTMAPSLEMLEAALPYDVLVFQETAGFVPMSLPEISEWCREKRVYLLEDAAQSVGALVSAPQKHGGAFCPAGGLGDAAVFSLSGTKPLTSGGQGGVLVTDDGQLATAAKQLKNYGRTEMFQRGMFKMQGWNMHMTELQAAVGLVALEHREEHTAERQAHALLYDAVLPRSGLIPCGGRMPDVLPTWYKYPLLLPATGLQANLRQFMEEMDIELSSGVYDVPTPRLPCFDDGGCFRELPGTEHFCGRHVCLPCHHRMARGDAERVAEALLHWCQAGA